MYPWRRIGQRSSAAPQCRLDPGRVVRAAHPMRELLTHGRHDCEGGRDAPDGRKRAAALNTQSILADVADQHQLVYRSFSGTPEASHLRSRWCDQATKHVECSHCSTQAHVFLERLPSI